MMAKRLFLLTVVLAFLSVTAGAQNEQPDLKLLRKKLILAINSSTTTDSLYNSLNKIDKKSPVIVAYMATLDALKAKHSWNPYSKIKELNHSEALMQKAVDAEPHNIEIRFLRFSIQHHVPGFLGYGKDLVSDREEILNQLSHTDYSTADKQLLHTIITFLIDSKRCTPQETVKLQGYLTDIK